MRNHEVTKVQPLLKEDGSLREPGWSRKLYQVYDRNAIKAPKFRIKEWDYYLVLSEKNNFGVAFTISDDGYIGLQSVSLLDFSKPWEHTETILNALPMGKLKLPSTSEKGDCAYHDKRLDMEFRVTDGQRRIVCNFKNFLDGKTFSCDITLAQPEMDTMVIATPWKEKKTAFYYNQKINCMRASGKVNFDGKEYVFDPSTDFGTLDWGRGVWTYDNTWYWSSLNCQVKGKVFGFNLGYGFGDTEAATENALFYNGKISKLEKVIFEIPKNLYDQWHLFTLDGRLEVVMDPILDRSANLDFKAVSSNQHQVFGMMRGRAILDGGKEVEFKDVMGFAERVHNKF